MFSFDNQDQRARAITAGRATAIGSSLLDGHKHYGVMRADRNGYLPERLVVNLTGTVRDTLADALAVADEWNRTHPRARRLGFFGYAVRVQ